MRISLNELRLLIREELKRLEERGAPDLGNVQFSRYRKDDVPKNEKDTPEEHELYTSLENWISTGWGIDVSTAEELQSLMKHPKYGKFFRKPKGGSIMMRGMRVPEKVVKGWLSGDVEGTMEFEGSDSGTLDVDFEVGSRTMGGKSKVASSWTYSEGAAEEFSSTFAIGGSGNTSVILYAFPDDNRGVFFDLQHVKDRVKGLDTLPAEQEVLALGSVKVSMMKWKKDRD